VTNVFALAGRKLFTIDIVSANANFTYLLVQPVFVVPNCSKLGLVSKLLELLQPPLPLMQLGIKVSVSLGALVEIIHIVDYFFTQVLESNLFV